MPAASHYMEVGPMIWMMHLHVNQKSDYDMNPWRPCCLMDQILIHVTIFMDGHPVTISNKLF